MPTSSFLDACAHRPVAARPVWLMRQAGRYMAEYRAVRARHSLLEICTTPALAAEVTITAAERLGVDAAIIFADLLLPAAPLGLHLEFTAGEGPRITPAIRTPADIARLPDTWRGELAYVAESVSLVHRHFAGALPVIGFSGAPFTLASYLIEGGASRNYVHAKRLMYDQPRAWDDLMGKLVHGLSGYLAEQVRAGAAAIQLFDSWVGALSRDDFDRFALPYIQRLVRAVQALGVPAIYFSTGTSAYLESVVRTGADVISLDWRMDLADAWRRLELSGLPMPVLQGNLDPVLLLGNRDHLLAAAARMLQAAAGRPGYIFNLGHGILPETPVENVLALVAAVHA